eukprot:5345311-Amphidinium_carterae.1
MASATRRYWAELHTGMNGDGQACGACPATLCHDSLDDAKSYDLAPAQVPTRFLEASIYEERAYVGAGCNLGKCFREQPCQTGTCELDGTAAELGGAEAELDAAEAELDDAAAGLDGVAAGLDGVAAVLDGAAAALDCATVP